MGRQTQKWIRERTTRGPRDSGRSRIREYKDEAANMRFNQQMTLWWLEGIAEEIKLSNIQMGWYLVAYKDLPESAVYNVLLDAGLEKKTDTSDRMISPGMRAVRRLIEEAKYISEENLSEEELADFQRPPIPYAERTLCSGSTLSVQRLPVADDTIAAARIYYAPDGQIDVRSFLETAARYGIRRISDLEDKANLYLNPGVRQLENLPYTGSLVVQADDGIEIVTDVHLSIELRVSSPLPRLQGADNLVNLLREVELPYLKTSVAQG